MQKHSKYMNTLCPRLFGATGNDAQKLHVRLFLLIFVVRRKRMKFYT